MKSFIRKFVILVLLAGMIAGGAAWYIRRNASAATTYRTDKIQRGDIVETIAATGTVEPEEVIDVGAQVAGQILSFGKDTNGNMVNYRSPVDETTMLAKLDDAVYQATVDQAE